MQTQPSKDKIIRAYKLLVKEHNSRPVGSKVFQRETGFPRYYWQGKYWPSWSAFQADAGFSPNSPTEKIPDDVLLRRFAELALEMNKVPTEPDVIFKRNQDSSFPSRMPFRRWGSRDALLSKVAEYCEDKKQFEGVLGLLRHSVSGDEGRAPEPEVKGFVYLLRSGKDFKLGRTNAIGQRLRRLSIQLPQKPDTVHVIKTDDPEGIEQYWHRRFAEKRQGGEWFSLTAADVKAFKKRRFQ